MVKRECSGYGNCQNIAIFKAESSKGEITWWCASCLTRSSKEGYIKIEDKVN